ncbi:hypothetical protein COO72_08765, partial [Bifidobacterium callitrichos]
MYEDVDFLQQSSQYYFIDYIPYDTNDPSFLELEEYFENTYIGLFAEKIARILLKIMSLRQFVWWVVVSWRCRG